jgi:hypothetical protein
MTDRRDFLKLWGLFAAWLTLDRAKIPEALARVPEPDASDGGYLVPDEYRDAVVDVLDTNDDRVFGTGTHYGEADFCWMQGSDLKVETTLHNPPRAVTEAIVRNANERVDWLHVNGEPVEAALDAVVDWQQERIDITQASDVRRYTMPGRATVRLTLWVPFPDDRIDFLVRDLALHVAGYEFRLATSTWTQAGYVR